jgi:hypothetical protein
MPGFVFIEPAGLPGKAALSRWLRMARANAGVLPPKTPEGKRCTDCEGLWQGLSRSYRSSARCFVT